MNEAVAIALATILTISGWFQEGLQALQDKKYDEAVKKLTQVYEKDVPGNHFRELALFFRAQAQMGAKDQDKACADLLLLLQLTKDENLRKQSVDLYKAWGGDPKKLMPAESPKAVWEKFVAAAKKGDLDTCLALSTGDWLAMIREKTHGDADELKDEFDDDTFTVAGEKIGAKDDAGKAWITVAVGRHIKIDFELVLDPRENRWLLSKFTEQGRQGGDRNRGGRVNDAGNLKQIGLALLMYSGENQGVFPPNFQVLKDEEILNEGKVWQYVDPDKGITKLTYIYCPGLRDDDPEANTRMIAADPVASGGKRNVLFVDGHVELVDEEKFVQQAKKQNWHLKGVGKKEDIPKETQEKVKALVAQLADENFKVRREAKDSLLKMGYDIHPLLEDYLKHKDPEVRTTIEEILKGK